ncbi:MAG: hypothetical protein Q8N10_03465 [Phenylobacterium sp.]|uniref:hypothetical protein n=1 Tax=Phenylobacterium sp. TaxID=1871053 RepID=UPI00271F1F2C|nr:hypothetical protein [Phenylobacterium sp.]MDO8912329.1 hypothetical protein [Phenylobacterium sp.]MDP3099541.1 hypothetical protein [Phenylobacterium sp.]
MARKLKFKTSLLCDYATEGLYGKPTLVGVYSGDIVLTEMPMQLRLAYFGEIESTPTTLQINFLMNGAPFGRLDCESNPDAGPYSIILFPTLDIKIAKPSVIEIVGTCAGMADTVLLKSRFELGSMTR